MNDVNLNLRNNKNSYCKMQGCPINVIGPVKTTFIAYGVPTAVLGVPIMNAFGADVQNVGAIFGGGFNFSITGIGLLFVLGLSGLISAHDRHSHPALCALHSVGLPGTVLAIFTAINS